MRGQEYVQELLNQTTIEDDDYRKLLEWDADLGFMRQIGAESEGGVVVVGFCNSQPSPPEKAALPAFIKPRTTYDQLIEEEQKIGSQGKGTGPRLYNMPSAVTGLPEYTSLIGMYSVELDREHIHDMRKASDFTLHGKAQRIARHAGLIAYSRVCTSVRSTIDDINASFPDGTQAVLYNQPPNAERRENTTNKIPDVASEFMVIRDAAALLRKRGEAKLR